MCEHHHHSTHFETVQKSVTCKPGFMAHSNCTGTGPGTGLGTMGFYIMLCTVHTTHGQGMMGFYIMLCTVHYTWTGTGNDGFLYYAMYYIHYRGTGTGNDGFLYYAMYCTHYTGTGNDGFLYYAMYCTLHMDRNWE